MGLDTSHGCWHGAYSAFMSWRTKIAEVAELPPLELMEGFFVEKGYPFSLNPYNKDEMARNQVERIEERLPIKWSSLKEDAALYELLSHSDCEGELAVEVLTPLADRLAELLPLFPDEIVGGHIENWKYKTQIFIDGLRLAAKKNQKVKFQ